MKYCIPVSCDKSYWYEYDKGERAFGSARIREDGHFKHAGCDLYTPDGTSVRAIADGKIMMQFGMQSDAAMKDGFLKVYVSQAAANVPGKKGAKKSLGSIVVNHGGFLARYCEIENGSRALKVGDTVKLGDELGKTSNMYFRDGKVRCMLHLEIYSDVKKDLLKFPLSGTGNGYLAKFKRREDLIDPTPYLNYACMSKPVLFDVQQGIPFESIFNNAIKIT